MAEVAPRRVGELIFSNVRRRFHAVEALAGLSLKIPSGTVAALIGPNGSGKTTLLRIAAGTLDADEGSVEVAGSPPGRGNAGYVPAGDRALYWRLTALQNLVFFGSLAGDGPAATENTFNALVDDRSRLERHFGLASRMARSTPVKQLSFTRRLSEAGAVRDAILADI